MISILQHDVRSSELLARRLAAMGGRIDPQIWSRVDLDGAARECAPTETIFDLEADLNQALLLKSGIVGEVRRLADGRRQILAVRLPGDVLRPMVGETAVALTLVRVVEASPLIACLGHASEEFQPLRRAWVRADGVDRAMQRDHLVRLGRMSAYEGMAHLLLEAHERLLRVGLAEERVFHLPLTQDAISDVVGLSVVHLNRTLQSLRRDGVAVLKQGYVTLADRARLVQLAGYVSRFPVPWRPSAPAQAGLRMAAATG